MKNKIASRRIFLFQFLSGLTLGLGSLACKTKAQQPKEAIPFDSCTDFSQVPEEDMQLRKSLGYVEMSPMRESTCANCNLYLPPDMEGNCGGCTLFSGPVYEDAFCTYWAPQADL